VVIRSLLTIFALCFSKIPWVPETLPSGLASHAIDALALVEVTEDDWENFFHVHERSMQQQLCMFVRQCSELTNSRIAKF
jgi:hypothetical protein